jgi:hypothetical protein
MEVRDVGRSEPTVGAIANTPVGIDADSVYLGTFTQAKYLKPVLDSEPPPTTVKVNRFTAVLSQPLTTKDKWNDKQKRVVDWSIYVGNLGHGMYDFGILLSIIPTFLSSAKGGPGGQPRQVVAQSEAGGEREAQASEV